MPRTQRSIDSAPFQQSPPLLIRSALLRSCRSGTSPCGRSIRPARSSPIQALFGRVFRRRRREPTGIVAGWRLRPWRARPSPSGSAAAFQQTLRGLASAPRQFDPFRAKTCFALVVGHLVLLQRASSSAPSERRCDRVCGRGLLSLKRSCDLCCVAPVASAFSCSCQQRLAVLLLVFGLPRTTPPLGHGENPAGNVQSALVDGGLDPLCLFALPVRPLLALAEPISLSRGHISGLVLGLRAARRELARIVGGTAWCGPFMWQTAKRAPAMRCLSEPPSIQFCGGTTHP